MVHVGLIEVGQTEVETDCIGYSGSEVGWVHMEGEVWVLMFQPGKKYYFINYDMKVMKYIHIIIL